MRGYSYDHPTLAGWRYGYCEADVHVAPAVLLESIYCKAIVPPTCDQASDAASFWKISLDIPVYIPKGTLEAYRNAPGWSGFTNLIETDTFPSSGINDVAPDNEARTMPAYDAQGRMVQDLQQGGLYIQKGRKFIHNSK